VTRQKGKGELRTLADSDPDNFITGAPVLAPTVLDKVGDSSDINKNSGDYSIR
jgi:hypothetical protein